MVDTVEAANRGGETSVLDTKAAQHSRETVVITGKQIDPVQLCKRVVTRPGIVQPNRDDEHFARRTFSRTDKADRNSLCTKPRLFTECVDRSAMKWEQSWIARVIASSHSSPPRSSNRSNHASIRAACRSRKIRVARTASSRA